MASIAAGFADDDFDCDKSDVWRKAAAILLRKHIITDEQLRLALQVQEAARNLDQAQLNLGKILADLDFATNRQVAIAVAEVHRMRYFDFKKHKVDPEAVKLVPESILKRCGVLPVMLTGNGKIIVAVSDPLACRSALDEVRDLLRAQNLTPVPVIAVDTDLAEAVEQILAGMDISGTSEARLQSGPSNFSELPSAQIALTAATRIACVWGHPVAHSRSPRMQNAAIAALGLDWAYVAFDVAPESLEAAVQGLRAMNFVGANCTVPLKEQVGQYLDALDPTAERIGSVNTVVNRDGRLTGHSTDGAGLAWDLERQDMLPTSGESVLIWGAGGSARAIAAELAGRGLRVTVANRTLARAEEVARIAGNGAIAVGLGGSGYEEAISAAELLINATTLGMSSPSIDLPPLPPGEPLAGKAVYDIVYSPTETALLAHAREQGCRSLSNGAGMLACQGALALSLWSGIGIDRIPLGVMLSAASGG